jgi:exoribonuclease R
MLLPAWVTAFAKNKSPVSRRKIIRSTTIYIPRNLMLMKPDRLQKLSLM